MTQRMIAIIRALALRGYSECRCPPESDYRRWRISPTHARRLEVWSTRRRRWLQGDVFLLDNGRLMLGVTRQIAVAIPPATVDALLRDGQPRAQPPRSHPTRGPVGMTLEELLA